MIPELEVILSRRCLNPTDEVELLVALAHRYQGTVGIAGRGRFYRQLADGQRLPIAADELQTVRSELGLVTRI
jgi:hypothetical protein